MLSTKIGIKQSCQRFYLRHEITQRYYSVEIVEKCMLGSLIFNCYGDNGETDINTCDFNVEIFMKFNV